MTTAQSPVTGPTVRDRVAAFLAGAAGMAPVDAAAALDEAGLLASDPPRVPAPMTREQAARALAELADGHVDNADVYLDNLEYASQAQRRAQRRLVTSDAWEPDEDARRLAAAWQVLADGGRR